MNVEIAERLAAKRKERGYSQEQLAAELGVSRQAVSKWERSESSPDTDNLISLAKLYGVSLDELLYVDDSIADDVHFEARDKAESRSAEDDQQAAAASAAATAAAPDESSSSQNQPQSEADESNEKVHVGVDGVHVEDGKDYVHISWKDGVHVIDGEKGEEVHVGWNGVHVRSADATIDGPGVVGGTSSGNTVDIDGDKVYVNGNEYTSWKEAHDSWKKKSAPSSALKFPFPLLVLLAYIVQGLVWGTWGLGTFLIFLIPAYYIIVAGVKEHHFAATLAGLYPLGCLAWFLYMAFVLNLAHPAWVIFLTIPIVEWLIMWPSHALKKKRRADEAAKVAHATDDDVIDVTNQAQ